MPEKERAEDSPERRPLSDFRVIQTEDGLKVRNVSDLNVLNTERAIRPLKNTAA